MKRLFLILIASTLIHMAATASEKLEGTPIASYQKNAGNAFDDNANTYYSDYMNAEYAWIGLDLGRRCIIKSVKWTPYKGNESATLLGVFQGANNEDFSDAIPMGIIDDETKRESDISCSRGFRFVRYVGPADSYALIQDLEFHGEDGDGDDSRLWQITNLPTVCVNTVNGEIPYDKETYISSTFILISDEGTKVMELAKTGIRERGNASRQFPKKPWKIKFDKKQNILDAPAKAKKWTLINNYGDKTLMRNMLAFDIARKMGMEYVPYCTPVDVVFNGEYKGCYQLCDQVEVNPGRVEIEEMQPTDIKGEELTGGYFVEIDGYAEGEPVWFQTNHYYLPVTVKSPDEEEIVSQQLVYIKNYFNSLETSLKDTDPNTGYRTVFDNESFIQHMLVNELAGNTDIYWSTFMYKERNDPRIYTGPVWDFDLGFNNDYRTYPVTEKSGNGYLWDSGLASGAGNMRYFAQRVFIKDESTKPEILEVWKRARENGLTAQWLEEKVEEYAYLLDASQHLNFLRWPILKQAVHMNPRWYGSYEAECDAVIAYMAPQLDHLDKVIGYEPGLNGVESITTDENNGEVSYYTITGIKVDKPLDRGFYIEVKGKKSRKIFVP